MNGNVALVLMSPGVLAMGERMDLGKQSHPGTGQDEPVGFRKFYGIVGSHRLENPG